MSWGAQTHIRTWNAQQQRLEHGNEKRTVAHHFFITFCLTQLHIRMESYLRSRSFSKQNRGKYGTRLEIIHPSLQDQCETEWWVRFLPNPSFMLHLVSHLDNDAKHCHCQVKQDQSTRNTLVVLCLGLIDCQWCTPYRHPKACSNHQSLQTSASPTLLHHLGCPCVYCSSR